VLVMGGCGDYFDQADCTICMLEYKPHDVTAESKAIAKSHRSERKAEGGQRFGTLTERKPVCSSFDPARGKREVKISPKGLHSIGFGAHTIDLSGVEQLVDVSQTRAIGDAIYYATRHMNGEKTMHQVISAVAREMDRNGLDILSSQPKGDYAMFRPLELAAAINRLRTLRVQCAKQ
ncbi:MAG: P-loop domain-containing protein, partial [bacterium]